MPHQTGLVFLLVVSFLFQSAAAVLAFRLIGISGRRAAWLCIAAALALMALRRLVPLYRLFASDPVFLPDPFNEAVGVLLSGLMTAGIALIAPLFREHLRSETLLRQNEHRLAEAQRLAHVGSWDLDLATGTLTWSDEIYRIFEVDPGRFGASYEAFLNTVHPDDRDVVDRAYTDSVRTRAPYAIDHRLLMPDGRIKHVHERCETSYDQHGRPLRSIGTVQDVTERRMAEEALIQSEERYRALVDNIDLGITLIDRQHRIVAVNKAQGELFHKPAASFVGKYCFQEFEKRPAICAHCPGIAAMAESRPNEVITEGVRDDGSRFVAKIMAFPMKTPGELSGGFIEVVENITAQKQMQDELQMHRKHLEEEVQKRTAELTAKSAEFERMNRLFVGRELRMKELKERIRKLEAGQ